MKLTMKDNYSFQKAEGYLDDPDMMSVDEVKEQLRYWHGILEGMDMNAQLPSDLVYLSSFIKSLADGEVEYEEPLHEYEYTIVFEYSTPLKVMAKDENSAALLAIHEVKQHEKMFESTKRWGNTLVYADDGDEIYDKFNDPSSM